VAAALDNPLLNLAQTLAFPRAFGGAQHRAHGSLSSVTKISPPMHLRIEQLGIPSTVPKRLPRRRHRRAACSCVLGRSGTSSYLVKRGDATADDERLAQVPAARSRSSSESTTRGPGKAIPGAAPSRSTHPFAALPPAARKLSPSLMVGHRHSPCHRGGSLVSGTRKSTRSKPSGAPSDVTSDRHAQTKKLYSTPRHSMLCSVPA
jgi:hypothetical protein